MSTTITPSPPSSAEPSAAVRVSVCLPTYNGARFLIQSIRSVLAQTFADFELVVVDDGSSDATVEIVRSFTDTRIRLVQNARQLGIPGNWNHCLTLAQGEFVCIFHQDDIMLPDNLARKVEALMADPAVSFVHSAAEVLLEQAAPEVATNWIEESLTDFVVEGEYYFRKLFLNSNAICAPTVLTYRQLLLDLGGFDLELGYAPDYEMWMKLCAHGKVAFLSQPLVLYRWHEGNASHAFRFERGVEELQTACRRALQHHVEQTGRQEEGRLLTEALQALMRLRSWANDLTRGREWQAQRVEEWQRIAEERAQWITELEKGKAWLEEQRQHWQTVAKQQEAWITELEKGKAWLEEQMTNWQTVAKQQEAWITELEKGKAWLEEQRQHWQKETERYREVLARIYGSKWGRVGARLGMIEQRESAAAESGKEPQE